MSLKTWIEKRPRFVRGLFLLMLIGLCVIDSMAFPALFGTTYLSFYTKAGTAVALGVLLMELSWKDIGKHVGLTSRDPIIYVGSTFQLIGLPIVAFGVGMSRGRASPAPSAWDVLFCIPFIFVALCGMALWVFAIAPAQYFVNFVCSAPARLLSGSNAVLYARLEDGWYLKTDVRETGQPAPTASSEPWWDASIRGKEQRLTSACSAVLIVTLGWALSAVGWS